MSTIYECIDCEQVYCVECDGGEDSCSYCSTGPRCHDCAAEHPFEDHPEDEDADAAGS